MNYTRQHITALRREEAIMAGFAKGRSKEQVANDIGVCIDTLKAYCRHLNFEIPDYAPRGPNKPKAPEAFEFKAPVKKARRKKVVKLSIWQRISRVWKSIWTWA